VDAGLQKGKLSALETTRRRYDSIALAVATLPVVMIWPTPVTAPIALYLCVSHWNDPAGILPRTRWRSIAAFLIALIQILAWLLLIAYVVANRRVFL
jgi:hypothetical protein